MAPAVLIDDLALGEETVRAGNGLGQQCVKAFLCIAPSGLDRQVWNDPRSRTPLRRHDDADRLVNPVKGQIAQRGLGAEVQPDRVCLLLAALQLEGPTMGAGKKTDEQILARGI